MDDARDPGRFYDAYYYEHCLGEPCRRDNPTWARFFGRIADVLVAELRPASVLDLGCGFGFLVEALRDRGVEAWGIDISEYAIAQVREDVRPFCSVGSVTDPLGRDYDVIVCIEVLEHLPRDLADVAVENIAAHAKTILFSSTPDDFREATHLNVQPTEVWVELLARRGFFRDLDFDAGFVTPQAILFRRSDPSPAAIARAYERWHWRTAVELRELRAANLELTRERAQLEALAQIRDRVAPEGTRRGAVLRRLARRVRR